MLSILKTIIGDHWIKILVVIAVIGVLWSAYAWRKADISHWKDEGRAECVAEYDEAKRKADEAAAAKQNQIKKRVRSDKNEIRNAEGANDLRRDSYRGVLERLRANHPG